MLDDKLTSLSKLQLAYDLNELEADTIISELWPNGIFPYASWETAYKQHWKQAISNNINFISDTEQKIPSFPEFDPLENKEPLLHIINSPRIVTFFKNIAAIIFVIDLKEGLEDLCNLTYEEKNKELQDDMGEFFDGLSELESQYNKEISHPSNWEQSAKSKLFQGLCNEKHSFIAKSPFCIHKLFRDAIVLDKTAAIRYLDKCGYSLKRAVKGISQSLVNRLTKDMDASPPEEPEPSAASLAASAESPNLPDDTPDESSAKKTIVVPRYLLAGKTPNAVLNGMRKKEIDDCVIAYVLFYWYKLANKRLIGELFAVKPNQIPSTHYRRAESLLKRANREYNITSA